MGGDVDGILHPETSSSTVNGIPRLDVPPLTVNDGPGGIRQGIGPASRPATALPAPLALGASFDLELAARYARVIAAEAKRARPRPGARTDGQSRARPARRAHLRELRRGPAAAERRRVAWIRALQGAGVIARRQALRREQPGDRPLHRRRDHRRAHAARDLPPAFRGGGEARARRHGDDRLQQGERRLHGRQPPAHPRTRCSGPSASTASCSRTSSPAATPSARRLPARASPSRSRSTTSRRCCAPRSRRAASPPPRSTTLCAATCA